MDRIGKSLIEIFLVVNKSTEWAKNDTFITGLAKRLYIVRVVENMFL